MKPDLTQADVIVMIRSFVEGHRTQAKAAEAIGISPAYLGDILKGKTEPGPTVLKFFGLEREIIRVYHKR